ncbi:11104_t:CDS:2, partial [Gigaspora margarita]
NTNADLKISPLTNNNISEITERQCNTKVALSATSEMMTNRQCNTKVPLSANSENTIKNKAPTNKNTSKMKLYKMMQNNEVPLCATMIKRSNIPKKQLIKATSNPTQILLTKQHQRRFTNIITNNTNK